MNNMLRALLFSLLALFFSVSLSHSTFGFYEYQDDQEKLISFKFLPKRNTSWEERQNLFVSSFGENYRDISPNLIESHFKSHSDITDWLQDVFKEEVHYFKTSLHPINFIDVFKEDNLIGLAIIEQWNDEKETIHIRIMAISPEQAGHGYGTALVNVIKKLSEAGVNRIIADTRKINERSRRFYTKLGFNELDTPHDPELASTGNYLGLEWTP